MSRLAELRRMIGATVVDGFFGGTSRLAKLHPLARPEKHGVELITDIPYAAGGREHLADIYRPKDRKGPLPVVLYVHGGGFRILSKDSHWVMGLMFARRGYLVVSINYRLAPRFPYPAALEDCAEAYAWVVEHAPAYGGDVSRLVLAGESAGANLVTAMTVAATYERAEPFAKRIFDTGVVPKATLAACGILQVTDSARFGRRRPLPPFILDRLVEVERSYLPKTPPPHGYDFADPLVVFERGAQPARPIPPFFLPVGTKDPLLDDSRRLAIALSALGVKNEMQVYLGEPHAFHAFVWRRNARDHWRHTFRFLDEVLGSSHPLENAS